MNTLSELLLISFLLVVAYGMAHDVLARTIPDTVSFLLLAIGLCHRLTVGQVLPSCEWTILWIFIMFGLYIAGILGGGDAKMMVGISFMMPISPLYQFDFAVIVAIAGGGVALFYIMAHYLFKIFPVKTRLTNRSYSLWNRWRAVEAWRIRHMGGIPYGIALGIGAIVVLA